MNEATDLLPSLFAKNVGLRQESKLAGQFSAINPLVTAAMPLLVLMIFVKKIHPAEPVSIRELQDDLVNELLSFIEAAYQEKYPQRTILAAKYCLCTALDEAVLATPWGHSSAWPHQTLLSILQKETWGGERFFIILEEMVKLPKQNLHLLELLYIILSLGFEGKYYKEEPTVRDEIRHGLFNVITPYREQLDQYLSPSLKIAEASAIITANFFSKRNIIAISLMLLGGIWVAFNIASYFSERVVMQEFIDISNHLLAPHFGTGPML
jgi:type VI secretion system protein ImpK